MGGFLGIGGNSANTDRSNTLQGYADLNSVFNTGLGLAKAFAPAGTAATAAGTSAIGSSLGYWNKLLSGNRASLMQAIAPEANTVQTQADAAKRQQEASGTARGGGTAAQNQQRDTSTQAQIDNALFGVRPTAANQVGSEGRALASVGQSTTGDALAALGLGNEAANELTSESIKARPIDNSINHQAIGDVTGFLGSVLDAIPGLPGGITGIFG